MRHPCSGFFSWVDGAPPEGYRAPRGGTTPVQLRTSTPSPVIIVTGEYGAQILEPLVAELATAARADVSLLVVDNQFFGGNIAVTGLLTGADVSRALDSAAVTTGAAGARYLLPDVVLSNGRFLDGTTPDELPRPVEVVATDGASLVAAVRS